MSWSLERIRAGQVLEAFTSAPVLWPNSSAARPAPTSSGTPAAYVEAELEYSRRAELADFAGGVRVDGEVVLTVYVERRAGDELARELADALGALFAAGDGGGVTFFPAAMVGGRLEGAGGDFYGRRLVVPFVRFT